MRAPFVVAVAVVAGLAGVGAGQLDELGAQGRQGDGAVDLADARLVDLSHASTRARSTGRPRSSSS